MTTLSWTQQCQTIRDQVFAPQIETPLVVGILEARRRGARSVFEIFGGCLEQPGERAQQELARHFALSSWFDRYGERTDSCDQVCLEEAFYQFLCESRKGTPELREAEFLAATIRALAVQPCPAFRLPAQVRTLSTAFFATTRVGGRLMLFACCGGQLVRGPVNDEAAAILLAQSDDDSCGRLGVYLNSLFKGALVL